jgi:hypothetical protein
MSKRVVVSDPVAEVVTNMAEEYDISKKEAIARVFKEGGYDV